MILSDSMTSTLQIKVFNDFVYYYSIKIKTFVCASLIKNCT